VKARHVILLCLLLLTINCQNPFGSKDKPKQYTLTMAVNQADWGTVSPEVGSHKYDEGSIVAITATSSNSWDYQFVSWTGDVAYANSATTTVTMTDSMTVMANFEEKKSVVNGSITITGDFAGEYTFDRVTCETYCRVRLNYDCVSWRTYIYLHSGSDIRVEIDFAGTSTGLSHGRVTVFKDRIAYYSKSDYPVRGAGASCEIAVRKFEFWIRDTKNIRYLREIAVNFTGCLKSWEGGTMNVKGYFSITR